MPAHLSKNFQNSPSHTHFTRYAPHPLPKTIESGVMPGAYKNPLNTEGKVNSAVVAARKGLKKRPPEKARRSGPAPDKVASKVYMAAAKAASPDKPITQMQRLFVQLHVRGESVQNALYKAGYNTAASYGYQLLQHPGIKALVEQERAKFREDTKLERIHIIEMLREAYDMAKLMSEPASMVSAAREMGKLIGAYEPKKVEINIATGGQRAVQQLSDEELFRKIEEMKTDALALTHQAEDLEEAEDALDRRN